MLIHSIDRTDQSSAQPSPTATHWICVPRLTAGRKIQRWFTAALTEPVSRDKKTQEAETRARWGGEGGGVGGSLRQQKGLDLQYFNILAFICLQIVKTQLKVSSSANDKLHQWWREWWGDREAPVLDCFWNEGSYQDEFGKMPHSCSHSKFVLSLSETQIGSPAHTFIHLSP